MRLILEHSGVHHDVQITRPERATWAQVVEHVLGATPAASPCYLLDGRAVDADALVTASDSYEGSLLSIGPGEGPSPDPATNAADAAAWVLTVIGGLDAGTSHPLRHGTTTIGRDPANHLVLGAGTVSRRHARVHLEPGDDSGPTVVDAGSCNGTWIDGEPARVATRCPPDAVVAFGAVHARIAPAPPPRPHTVDARPDREGRIAFNRPPRMAESPPARSVPAPAPERTVGGHTPFSWAMLLAPLVVGLVMAAFFSPAFAVFALLSPVMMLASWAEQRRRRARSQKRSTRQHERALETFAAELRAAVADRRAHLERSSPDPERIARRAQRGESTLWERRAHHDDFGLLRVGTATISWCPELDHVRRPLDPSLAAIIERGGLLPHAPVTARIGPGQVIGITGHPTTARALARSLVVQAAVLHGPADLRILTASTTEAAPSWALTSWLPHARPGTGDEGAVRASTPEALAALGRRLRGDEPGRPGGPGSQPGDVEDPDVLTLVIVDALDATTEISEGRAAHGTCLALARQLAPPHSAVVLVPSATDLPASCTSVIECLDEDGTAVVHEPRSGRTIPGVHLDGLSDAQATTCARHLGRYVDTERRAATGQLPSRVELATLVQHGTPSADEPDAGLTAPLDATWVSRRWAHHREVPGLPATIGVDADGPRTIDLVADGPHALIAGTTGSGKSELLRTLVVSLAVTFAPADLAFVLIDYKGGSAFDACGALPHVVGVVTDLDDRLAERALRSLEAELRRRERILRAAGADDIAALRRTAPDDHPVLSRLVVVIDEFAGLARDVPGFIDALVGVAQRGRSLGVHLILATQRPHGSVNDNIRTNTNLRIALRVLHRGDSVDVIGTGDAASISRLHPGRACVSVGEGEPERWQAALVSNPSSEPTPAGGAPTAAPAIVLDAFGCPRRDDGDRGPTPAATRPPSDLERFVAAVVEADQLASGCGRRTPPVAPWLPPLPPRLTRSRLNTIADVAGGAPSVAVPLGLTDEPDEQRQRAWCWDPATGPLVLYGMPGSGTTSALTALAEQLLGGPDAERHHLYVVEPGSSSLSTLEGRPGVGSVITFDERARVERLVRWLEAERTRRLAGPPPVHDPASGRDARDPRLFVLIDGASHLRHTFDGPDGLRLLETLARVAATGANAGIHVAMTGDRPQSIPASITAATSNRVILRLPDTYDYRLLGVPSAPGDGPPGRGVLGDGTEIQLAVTDSVIGEFAGAATGDRPAGRGASRPHRIGVLPSHVPFDELPAARCDGAFWQLPVGIGDQDLVACALDLGVDDHVLIAGPPRSGRSAALQVLARGFLAAGLGEVIALTPLPSPLRTELGERAFTTVAGLIDAVDAVGRRRLVLIDDADRTDDAALGALIARADKTTRIVVAGHTDRLRQTYGHWARRLREGRVGLALRPVRAVDGDLWGVRLPGTTTSDRDTPRFAVPVGRGVLIRDGHLEIVQVARP